MERWKSVPGMRGIEASDHGRIRRNGKLTAAKRINEQYRHRIIARAWLGLRTSGNCYVVKFRRGRSCRISNLYICTSAESHQRRPARGEAQGHAILSESAVREILALRGKLLQKEIARRYGISRQAISDIWYGRTWRHLRRDSCCNAP